MKKRYIKMGIKRTITAVCILWMLLFTTMLAFAEDHTDKDVIESLVMERTEIMGDFLASKTSYWETAEKLETIETGRLLTEDLDNLRASFRTDIEYIENCQIKDVTFTKSDDDMLCAVVEMEWELCGLSGKEKINNYYSVICKKTGNSFQLVQFF
ncbi:MAG: hypothetical protein HFE73_05910 [Firmicutes bacterium]|jgi:hypothetical protein|nr:hypothetical protein [Bacillota bacterium]